MSGFERSSAASSAHLDPVSELLSQLPPPAPTFVNPYAGHRNLTPAEADLLGEYARLAATMKRVAALSTTLSETPHPPLLALLRVLERKMGLVLTLFKASVWAIVVEQEEEEFMRQEEMDREQGRM